MIKKGLNKFAKGMFAIFTIKLMLFGIFFLTQACQKDDNHNFFIDSEKEVALKNFENSLNNIVPKTNTIIRNYEVQKKDYKLSQAKRVNINTNIIKGLNALEEKTEFQVKTEMIPLLENSLLLLDSYGFSEEDVQDVYSKDSPIWIIVGLAINSLEKEKEKENEIALGNNINFLSTSLYAQGNKSWNECVGQAGGFTAVINVVRMALKEKTGDYLKSKAGKALFKKTLRKALLKLSSRLLGGWISVGFFVYDFAKCMKWLSVAPVDSTQALSCDDLVRVNKKPSLYPGIDGRPYNINNHVVYLSKKAIGYVSDDNHNLENTYKDLKIYHIDDETRGNNCKVIETYYYTNNTDLIISSVTSDIFSPLKL